MNIFTVTFDQFNASLLKLKLLLFFIIYIVLTPNGINKLLH